MAVGGLGSVAVYLFLIAAALLWKCLRIQQIHPLANEPKNLFNEDFDLDAIKKVELRNKQFYIDFNRDRNDMVGLWLNRCRALAIATPIIFFLSSFLAH